MADRFDHLAVVVPDLPAAVEQYTAAGFVVQAGGRHPDLGTENAIIRFGADYLELLAVRDPERTAARGPFGQAILDALAARPDGGLLAYVLATNDIDGAAVRLRSAAIPFDGPFPMERERPDGRRLAWRLLVPHGVPWRRPWPMLIEWATPDRERLGWEPAPVHPNGARGLVRLEVLVRDLPAAARILAQGLGINGGVGPAPQAGRVGFRLGETLIELVTPADPVAWETVESFGEGPDQAWLATVGGADADLAAEPRRHGLSLVETDRPDTPA
jgi:catechol 2,3-dioxygenase-like lactoylglutathione lyase family enzyme